MNITPHVACYAMLHAGGSIALIHKARGPHRGKWDLPGGGMQPDEGALGTLVREIAEETGLQVEPDEARITIVGNDLLELNPPHGAFDHMHQIGILYEVRRKEKEALKEDPDGEDSLGARWFTFDEAAAMEDLTPFARYAVSTLMFNQAQT